MKKLLTLLTGITILSSLLLANFDSVSAYASEADGDADRPLCLPNFSESVGADCLEAGPIAKLQELAAMGITYPKAQIYASLTPYELATTPFSYAQLVDDRAFPLMRRFKISKMAAPPVSFPKPESSMWR